MYFFLVLLLFLKFCSAEYVLENEFSLYSFPVGGEVVFSPDCILSGHDEEIRCCAFSSDGKELVSGDHAGCIKYWNTDDGSCCKTYHIGKPISALAIQENGQSLERNATRLNFTKNILPPPPAGVLYPTHLFKEFHGDTP